jgi:hypothetical protein
MRRAYQARSTSPHRSVDGTAVPLAQIVALVEGRGGETERLATLDAVMRDAGSTREFELLRALAANVRPKRSIQSRRLVVITSLAAAALLMLVGLPELRALLSPAGTETVRAGVQGPDLLRPTIEASPVASRTFEWRAVSGARAYVLEILTADGTLVFNRRTTQTSIVLPPEVRLSADTEYRWWVTSELTDGTQRRSPFRRLVVRDTK